MRSLLRCCSALIAFALLAPGTARAQPVAPRIATLNVPGTPAFAAIARDVIDANASVTPDFASQSGLFEDAMRVPSFSPGAVASLHKRLALDIDALRAMPWRTWDVDRQIDFRWIYATAETLDRHVVVERMYERRPGEWLETTANNMVAVATWGPQRIDVISAIAKQIPAMVDEMRARCKEPTKRDVATARELIDATIGMLRIDPRIEGRQLAIASLERYAGVLAGLRNLPEYKTVGNENYAWRLRRAELLGWTPAELLARAQHRLTLVDRELETLRPKMEAEVAATDDERAKARELTQASLLGLYDTIQTNNRAEIERADFVTIPPQTGPIRARVTPDAVVPLTGDGGSMNPPPPFLPENIGWWNVEHLDPKLSVEKREAAVRAAVEYRTNGMGPYAAHEGFPGHHLQLSIARLNPNPIRNLFQDSLQNEGWALYAEDAFWQHGGLGPSMRAHVNMLQSWRFRIRRVVYDVNVETNAWTLQQGADFKSNAVAGAGRIDPDLLRSINWPTQLMCYFAGKEQILELQEAYRKKLGSAYSDRRFNDELLAIGSLPYAFARAKLLGEPVPDL